MIRKHTFADDFAILNKVFLNIWNELFWVKVRNPNLFMTSQDSKTKSLSWPSTKHSFQLLFYKEINK